MIGTDMIPGDDNDLLGRLGSNEQIISDAAEDMRSLVLELGPNTRQAKESIARAIKVIANTNPQAQPRGSDWAYTFVENYLNAFSAIFHSARVAYQDTVGILSRLKPEWDDLSESDKQLA